MGKLARFIYFYTNADKGKKPPKFDWQTITGTPPLSLTDAIAHGIKSLVQKGKCEQASTPTPAAPVNVKCNNGTIMWSPNLFRTTATSKTQAGVQYEVLEDGRIRCTGTATGYSDLAVGRANVSSDMGVIRIQLNGTYGGSGNIISSSIGLYNSSSSRLATLTYNTWTQYITVDLSEYPTVATVRIEIKRSSNKETDALIAVSVTVGSSEVPWSQYGILITRGTKETITLGEQTANAVNLLGIGDYADEQDIISGLVTRRIGVYVVDGTENWQMGTSFYTGGEILLDALESSHSCFCTHYKGKDTDTLYTGDANECQVGYDIGGTTFWHRIYITADRNTYATAADFKAFLAAQYAQGTPVIVLYPLDTPTTEEVAGQNLYTEKGTNTLSVTANVSNIQMEVEYAKGI